MSAIRLEERAKDFQRGLNLDEIKRKRDQSQVELRKKKRLEHTSKKRALAGKVPQVGGEEGEEVRVNRECLAEELLERYEVLGREGCGVEKLRVLVEVVEGGDLNLQVKALEAIKKVLSVDHNPPLQLLFSLNIAPSLAQLLLSPSEAILHEVIWIVVNLAAGPTEVTAGLVAAGCLPPLVALISHNNDDISSLAVWALSNIAGDSLSHRDLVTSLGAIETVMTLLSQPKELRTEHLEGLTWFLSNLCRGFPPPPDHLVDLILPMIPVSLEHESTSIVSDSCWILNYVTEGKGEEGIDKVMSLGVEMWLIRLLSSKIPQVQVPALRTLGNILTGNDSQAQYLLNLGLIDHLSNLLYSQNREIRKEVLWCFSNIAAGSVEQVCLLSEHPCMPAIISSLSDPDNEVKREALWTIANIGHIHKRSLLEKLLSLRVLEALVLVLDLADAALLLVALEAIARILKSAVNYQDKEAETNDAAILFENLEGTLKLESLQSHPNMKVYEKSVEVMGEFFGLIEVTDENKEAGNEVPMGGFQFS